MKEGLLSFIFFSINSNALFTIISDEVPLNLEIFPLSAKMGLISKKLVTLNHLSNPNSPGPYSSCSKINFSLLDWICNFINSSLNF